MAGGQGVARIVVARSDAALESPGVARALEGLGRGATVELVPDAPACIARCAGGDVDLVVVDAALGRGCEEILRALRPAGPPVVVAQEIPDDREALAWFRRGAADCVVARSERLGAAVSEQIARGRVRERGAADPERPDVTQHLNSALLVVDREGRIASCNPPAEQILAPGGEDLHGRLVSEWFRGGPDGESLLARSLEKGERFKGAETLATRADGSAVPVGISCAPIVDASGRISGAVVLFQDLSEVTRMRSHVLQREKMASIGQLAAGVAHEINNPMGFIHANLFQMAEYVSELRQVWGRVEALQHSGGLGSGECVRGGGRALPADRPREGDSRVAGGLGTHPTHRPGPEGFLTRRYRRAGPHGHQPMPRFDGQHRVAHDETRGRSREGIRGPSRGAVLPDADQAGVHEPARKCLPGNRRVGGAER
jgi:PAS domain S-box-containing protein